MSRRFLADLSERAIKSFLQGFGLAWSASSAGLAPGDWQGLKALAWGAGMAGLSALSSLLSKLGGDPESASAARIVDSSVPAVDLAAITAAVADRLGVPRQPPTSPVSGVSAPGGVSVPAVPEVAVQAHTAGVVDDDQLGH